MEPKFEHKPVERLTLDSGEIRKTAWYQWKYQQLRTRHTHDISDISAVSAYRSSAYADDDYTNDAEGRYL